MKFYTLKHKEKEMELYFVSKEKREEYKSIYIEDEECEECEEWLDQELEIELQYLLDILNIDTSHQLIF